MCALTKGFNTTSEKESFVLKKNATIVKFEERLDHMNGDGYLLAVSLYASPNDARKMHSEEKKPEGKILKKAKDTSENT